MKASLSSNWTSCSFLTKAPYNGGIAFEGSLFLRISSGRSSAINSFNQSTSSEVEGFFLIPGTFLTSKNISKASYTNYSYIIES